MSHTLTFSSTTFTIYVTDISDKQKPVIVKHQILDATHSTLQYMGSESRTRTLVFKLHDTSGSMMSSMQEYVSEGHEAYYTDDKSVSGSYVVDEFSSKRMQALNYTTAWYECSMTMTNLVASGSLYYQWTLSPPPR